MKRALSIAVALAAVSTISLAVASTTFGDATDRQCWDEYDLSGARKFRTITPKAVAVKDCTPGDGCRHGVNVNGKFDRLYVPYNAKPATCRLTATGPTVTAPTSTTLAPTTTTGRFGLIAAGGVLPSEADCARRVRPMTENRAANQTANATRGTRANTTYPRVTGNFSGTTDEIIQWAACKWGIDEDFVRAQIVNESYWQQSALGDFTTDVAACVPGKAIATYPPQFSGDTTHQGQCPESVGVGQVRYLYHQSAFVDDNAVRSTAYNLDYTYAVWRDCFEGRMTWLNQAERGGEYAAGDARGCLGVWFAGRWYTDAAKTYLAKYDETLRNRTWTQAAFTPATLRTASTTPTTTAATGTPVPTSATTSAPAPTAAPSTAATTTTRPPSTTTTTTRPPATTTTRPPAATPTTTALPASPTTPPPAGAKFVETFDGNTGLDSFRYGVYHRCVGFNEAGTPMPGGIDNNCGAGGTWSADHDLACGGPATQRTMNSDFIRDTDGSNAWKPTVDFHTSELLYTCKDHMMDTMGDIAGYSVVWFSPNQVFDAVNQVSFDVNLTNLGTRKWWKVAVVTDDLFNSSYEAGYLKVPVPGFMFSEVGTSELDGMTGPDRLVATWSGAAGACFPGAMKVGDTKLGCGYDAGTDKATRFPVSLTDNHNGTITFSVAGSTCTTAGSFPDGPVHVVFYDHNYNPNKDGVPIGYTFHWDNIVVR